MLNFDMKRKVKSANRKLAAAVLVLAASSSLAEEVRPPAYRMAVIIDDAYGRTMMSGNFQSGISKINSLGRKRANSFSAKNNLCVAYTKTSEIDKAQTVCDQALSISERYGRYGNSPLRPDITREQSLAYSNRGVLRAVTGDFEGAMQDFEFAAQLGADVDAAVDNLMLHKSYAETALTALRMQHGQP